MRWGASGKGCSLSREIRIQILSRIRFNTRHHLSGKFTSWGFFYLVWAVPCNPPTSRQQAVLAEVVETRGVSNKSQSPTALRRLPTYSYILSTCERARIPHQPPCINSRCFMFKWFSKIYSTGPLHPEDARPCQFTIIITCSNSPATIPDGLTDGPCDAYPS